MYRSDHDAALARIAALEADLARERSDDAAREDKLAKLEAALAKERAELSRAEAELAKLRPPKPEPEPEPEPQDVMGPRSTYLGPMVAGSVLVLLIVIAAATRCGKRKEDVPVPETPRIARIPDEIASLIAVAKKRAQEVLPGSRLLTVEGSGITEDGRVHPDHGALEAYFQVNVPPPKEPEVDPSVPIGAAPPVARSPLADYQCTTLRYRNNEWSEDSVMGGMCVVGDLFKNTSDLEPRCTMASIWARAKADGAPGGAIAEIRLQQYSWRFAIRDQRAMFEKSYPDDCE
jgi:hypothetical protein